VIIMEKIIRSRVLGTVLFLMAFVAFYGCDNNGGVTPVSEATYSVTVTNLTGNQPLSPLAAVVHFGGYTGWEVGTPASTGLENLAEGGDPAAFLAEAGGNSDVLATGSGSGVIVPGASDTVALTTAESLDLRLTCATMLVNTNDAFTGIADVPVGDLGVGASKRILLHPYDAGTEVNDETASTIPGPAAGGEGFNAERLDRDFVSAHSGVVTGDDGLGTSVLDESHRFISPVAEILVTRTQ
jgi:hypothetical protein